MISIVIYDFLGCARGDTQWISSLGLYMTDKFVLQSSTQWINDNIINVAHQTMIKRNVPSINGFQHTQLGKKLQFKIIDSKSPFIQILHVSGNHWVVVSNINCSKDVINIYDSLYTHVNKATLYQLFTFFKPQTRLVKLGLVNIQKQTNNCDCGLFAIAVAFELAAGNDPLVEEIHAYTVITCASYLL